MHQIGRMWPPLKRYYLGQKQDYGCRWNNACFRADGEACREIYNRVREKLSEECIKGRRCFSIEELEDMSK